MNNNLSERTEDMMKNEEERYSKQMREYRARMKLKIKNGWTRTRDDILESFAIIRHHEEIVLAILDTPKK